MAIHIRVARAPKELDSVFQVRACIRSEQQPHDSRHGEQERLVDHFDTFSSTHNILICDGDEPVGAMRVVSENELGLPGDQTYGFELIRSYLVGRVVGVDQICLRSCLHARSGILVAAMKVAVETARAGGGEHLLVLAPQLLEPHLDGIGLNRMDVAQVDGGMPLIPLYSALSQLRSPFVEWIQDPMYDALGSFLRRSIYGKGELIFTQNEGGACAYVVTRGSVRVTAKDPQGRDVLIGILGPGEVFGERALLDPGPRQATVRAYGHETDLIALDRKIFVQHIFRDRVRTEAMVQLFARQEYRDHASLVARSRDMAPLLVQVIRDSARALGITSEGLLPEMSLEWLTGRVGRSPRLVGRLTAVLERRGMIALCAEGLWVKDVTALTAYLDELIAASRQQQGDRVPGRGELPEPQQCGEMSLRIPVWTA